MPGSTVFGQADPYAALRAQLDSEGASEGDEVEAVGDAEPTAQAGLTPSSCPKCQLALAREDGEPVLEFCYHCGAPLVTDRGAG